MVSSLEENGWFEWLCHTNFSFLTGASAPEDYVRTALQLGYRGLGISDYDGVYGIVRAYRERRRLGAEDRFKLAYGAEIHLEEHHDLPLVFRNSLVLFAKNSKGYQTLCQLLTASHQASKTRAVLPLKDLLSVDASDLICLQPMRGLIRQGKRQASVSQCRDLKDHFGERFYFVMSRHLHPSEDCWIGLTWQLIQHFQSKFLFAQDPYFHEPEQKQLADLLQAIRLNQRLGDVNAHLFANAERSLRPLSILERRYRDLPGFQQGLDWSRELADSLTFCLSELVYRYPTEMLPAGESAQSYLIKLTWQGAKERYGENMPTHLRQKIEHELSLVEMLSFADYFLTVWDIVRWARSQNILCQGRGSAANSIICFLLGITAVSPEHLDLLFERFISAERGDPPDIDVDFEHERREEVIQYIYERYGRTRAAMVANVITFQRRGALRAVGKALGIAEPVLNAAAKRQAFREDRRQKVSAHLVKVANPQEIPWELWQHLAEKLRGFPRHLGVHSGGFIITDAQLTSLVALEPATMPGRTVVQWCKEDIEALGLFKIDILALGMLTAIRKILTLAESHHQTSLTLASIPPDDVPTYEMIQRADTVGTFQIESRAQMTMLPRLRPRCFYDIVVQVAIIRPGPIQGGVIQPFLRRRAGLEPVTYPDPRLEPILRRTFGIPIFQEQIMRIAMILGNFTPGEADELRRQIGAWSAAKNLDQIVKKLAEGLRQNGVAEFFVAQILNSLKAFASYGFPESHAASFGLLAYASCYLKRHFPAAFYASILNSQPMGFYSPHALVQSAKREGLEVLPICIQHSDWDHKLEKRASSQSGRDYAIRLGLRLVRGLRSEAAQRLQSSRQEFFQDIRDLTAKARLFRSDLTALAAANALLCFGVERRFALWIAEAAPFAPLMEEDLIGEQTFAQETPLDAMEQEFEATGTTLGEHPASLIKRLAWHYKIPATKLKLAVSLERALPNQIIAVFGMILVRQSPPTAKGMVFLTLEDETGFINLVFTPQTYQSYRSLVNDQAFVCAEGRLQKVNEGHSIMVTKLYQPQISEAELIELRAAEGSDPEILARTLAKARSYM